MREDDERCTHIEPQSDVDDGILPAGMDAQPLPTADVVPVEEASAPIPPLELPSRHPPRRRHLTLCVLLL